RVVIDHEGKVNDVGKSLAPRIAAKQDIVGAGFKKYEMRILFWRFGHELETENVGVEAAAASEVADRNRHVQDAFGLDHTHLQLRPGCAEKFLLRQLGKDFTRDQHVWRRIHGTFSCRSRSMTRGGLR